ncbi:MAG: prepilin-type N-terminal cleavage/methylation domain-containing protein [Phycisphaerae bacterium]|nr:prepilin-type N-terminal cleavage/methylation domain-containing protein [Phycisphaerae bacterium]
MKKMMQKKNTGDRRQETGLRLRAAAALSSFLSVPLCPSWFNRRRSFPVYPCSSVLSVVPSSSGQRSAVSPGAPGSAPTPVSCLLSPVSLPRSGFTLVEMLVVMSILVVMMAGVGEIFQTAGHTVRLGQATLQMMAGVRTVEAQLNHDLAHINPNGYLIIRGSYFAPNWDLPGYTAVGTGKQWQGDTSGASAPTPATYGITYQVGDQVYYGGAFYACVKANQSSSQNSPAVSIAPTGDWAETYPTPTTGYTTLPWQDDQLTFLANGTFQHRTGSYTDTATYPVFMDNLTTNAAAVWYGQLFMEPMPGNVATTPPLYPQPNQATVLPIGAPPTGATAGNYVLGRRAMLLVPGAGFLSSGAQATTYTPPGSPVSYAVYGGITHTVYAVKGDAGETSGAAITSSRIDAASISPGQIGSDPNFFTSIATSAATVGANVADNYCFRSCALPTPAASNQGLVNGYFRMTPVLLQGDPSFTVQWTDGSVNTATGTLNWYGLNHPMAAATDNTWDATEGTAVEVNTTAGTDPNDQYVAVFDAANRQYWPKALKITFTVTDPTNLLQGGRVITEVVRLPQ